MEFKNTQDTIPKNNVTLHISVNKHKAFKDNLCAVCTVIYVYLKYILLQVTDKSD